MNTQDMPTPLPNDLEEFERQLVEAMERKTEYTEWKKQLAATCHKEGRSFPSSYALQREWNAEQKKRAVARQARKKQEKAAAKTVKMKQASEKQLTTLLTKITELTGLQTHWQQYKAEHTPIVTSEELPDFDAIDKHIMQLQQEKQQTEKAVKMEQELLFQINTVQDKLNPELLYQPNTPVTARQENEFDSDDSI